jgi:hypothetical protein
MFLISYSMLHSPYYRLHITYLKNAARMNSMHSVRKMFHRTECVSSEQNIFDGDEFWSAVIVSVRFVGCIVNVGCVRYVIGVGCVGCVVGVGCVPGVGWMGCMGCMVGVGCVGCVRCVTGVGCVGDVAEVAGSIHINSTVHFFFLFSSFPPSSFIL